ncbi:MAG: ROK family protein [Bacillota bacterium]
MDEPRMGGERLMAPSGRIDTGRTQLAGDRVTVGVDLGGTKVAAGVVGPDGYVRVRAVEPTPVSGGAESILRAVVTLARQMVDEAHRADDRVVAVGVATPGFVDYPGRAIRWATHNLPGWTGTAVGQAVEAAVAVPVVVENDANCAALAEACFGAGRHSSSLLYVGIGTGIGAGLVVEGRLLRGANGGGGNLGHVSVDPEGPVCYCGNRGCVELYASGRAIASRYAEQAGLLGEGETISAEQVLGRALRGDPVASSVVQDAIRRLGFALATAVTLTDPGVVVLGGGVARSHQALLEQLHAYLPDHLPQPLRGRVRLLASELQEDAGLIGAAWLASRAGGSEEPIKTEGVA